MMMKKLFPMLALATLAACTGTKDSGGDSGGGADGATDGADGTSDGADGTSDGTADGADGTDGTSDGADGTDGTDGSDGSSAAGEALYASGCSGCHGADGDSGFAPDLSAVVPGMSASDIENIVINGKGSMPPVYTDPTQAADVTAYVIATWG
ncbi:MAG: cytochrome c [Deltaproteobacteria bacterium]|nr:cytochrome c [Deltaproteobacteria bacterium]